MCDNLLMEKKEKKGINSWKSDEKMYKFIASTNGQQAFLMN